jgi:hypothetical protein
MPGFGVAVPPVFSHGDDSVPGPRYRSSDWNGSCVNTDHSSAGLRKDRLDGSFDGRDMSMTCQELAARIQQLQPGALPKDVARLCLLLANYVDDLSELEDENRLSKAWLEMGMRLQAATDQHAAMTEDLESLARSNPSAFTVDQVWVLIRAIKVQSQVLQLYVGRPSVTA